MLWLLLCFVWPCHAEQRWIMVVGQSMEPTFYTGMQILVDEQYYQYHAVARNDIVTMQHESRISMIKRVVAIPGDKLHLDKNNKLYVNDVFLILINPPVWANTLKQLKTYRWIIPEGHYLLLGDNYSNSMDSSSFGLIKKENILGKAIQLRPKIKAPDNAGAKQ